MSKGARKEAQGEFWKDSAEEYEAWLEQVRPSLSRFVGALVRGKSFIRAIRSNEKTVGEDVLGATMVTILRKIREGVELPTEFPAFEAYCRQTAIYHLAALLRGTSRRLSREVSIDEALENSSFEIAVSDSHALERSPYQEVLSRVKQEFDEENRQIFDDYFVSGYTSREIAQRYQLDPAAVRQRLRRMIAKLRSHFERVRV
ncbi:MAG: RNA polymerase sigma factor [Terriglobales bacterium]